MRTTLSIFFLIFLLGSCAEDQKIFQLSPHEIIICGNIYTGFTENNSRISNQHFLPEGSMISFYAQGGIQAYNECLTLTNGNWNNHQLQWSTQEEEARIKAYYPHSVSAEPALYNEKGELTDLLICNKTFEHGTPIRLQFDHLFSLLTLNIDQPLNDKISAIEITPSVAVENILWEQGKINFTPNRLITTVLTQNNDKKYTLIIPPAENMSIHLKLMTPNETIDAEISPHSYLSGNQYVCNIKSNNQTGIYNAEDFIAFCHLINGETYGNRKLSEFGITENNQTTYFLQQDIRFTTEENEQITSIGSSPENIFNDYFNGQGYTLYGLSLQASDTHNNNSYALFSHIGANGKIANLNLSDMTYTNNSKLLYGGLLAGINEGVIDNCQIKQAVMNANQTYIGAITGANLGTILNSACENIEFIAPQSSVGGGIGWNNGKLLNSYVADCIFREYKTAAGLCFLIEKADITNCYTYRTRVTASLKNKFYALVYGTNGGNISYCYYQKPSNDNNYIYSNYNTQLKDNYAYDPETMYTITTKESLVVDLLNQWIEKSATTYPDYQFNFWQTAESPPIIFILQ